MAALIFDTRNRLLLLKRAGKHGAGTWAPPGGWIEEEEDRFGATAREVKEEVDLALTDIADAGFTEDFHPEGVRDVCLWMLCHPVRYHGPKINEPEKATDLQWFTFEEVVALEDKFLPLQTFIDQGGLAQAFRAARYGRREVLSEHEELGRLLDRCIKDGRARVVHLPRPGNLTRWFLQVDRASISAAERDLIDQISYGEPS